MSQDQYISDLEESLQKARKLLRDIVGPRHGHPAIFEQLGLKPVKGGLASTVSEYLDEPFPLPQEKKHE